jgi:hypothetical protein
MELRLQQQNKIARWIARKGEDLGKMGDVKKKDKTDRKTRDTHSQDRRSTEITSRVRSLSSRNLLFNMVATVISNILYVVYLTLLK